MKLLLVYALLLKASVTAFSGLSTLPVVREDFVVQYRLMTDYELNVAITAGRSGPGPNGVYLVSVGYLVAGLPGAVAGWLAMITPAFLVIPIVRFLGRRAEHPRFKSAIRASSAAGAGLMIAATLPLAQGALTSGFLTAIAGASFAVFAFTAIDSVWVIAASALVGLAAGAFSGRAS
jgi:chromate transporter